MRQILWLSIKITILVENLKDVKNTYTQHKIIN